MSLPGEGSGRDERLDVIAAAECRELAKSFRTHAAESGSSQKASLLRNIAHSFSSLATQLEGLADTYKAHGSAHTKSRVQGQEVPPRSRSADTNNNVDAVLASATTINPFDLQGCLED